MPDAVPLGSETCRSIESIHGAVESLVCSPQIGRHQIGMVEVGQCSVRMNTASIEHGLRQSVQFRRVRVPGRSRKGVVGETYGIAVIAFQTATDVAEPSHVHRGGKQCEIGEGGIFQDA